MHDKQSQELLAIMKGILDELVNITQELYLNRIGDKGL